MAAPAYRGGGYRRDRGGRQRASNAEPTDSGWLDRIGAWFDGTTPQYAGAGQPTSGAARSGTPVYQLVSSPTAATAGATITTPQTATPVIVTPRT